MDTPFSACTFVRRIVSSRFRTALLVLLFFIPAVSRAQIYDFKTYTVREGMLSNSVTCITQDSNGYLWIGTSDGLCVYDGASFRNYSVSDGLASSLVNCIFEDVHLKGVLWIGTNGGGVSRFESGRFRNFRLGPSDWPNRVNSIAQDSSGRVYCATDGGMFVLKGGEVSPLSPRLEHGSFDQVVCRGDSLLVVGANGILESFDIATGAVHESMTGRLSGIRVYRIGINYDGSVLAASYRGDVFDLQSGTISRRMFKPPARFVMTDIHGDVWIGTPNSLYKMSRLAGGGYSPARITTRNGLQQNDVTAGTIDREGDLWIGTAAKGVAKLKDEYSYQFPLEYGRFSANNSLAVSDRRGYTWIAAQTGVVEIWSDGAGTLRKKFRPYEALAVSGPCISVQTDSGNNLWLASVQGKIYELKIEKDGEWESLRLVRSFSVNRIMPGKDVLCLYVDRQNRIWYSRDLAGVLEIDPKSGGKETRLFTTKDGLPDNSVRAIYEDRYGNMWFGGYIGGLAELREGSFGSKMILYKRRDGLPDNSVRAICEDDTGNLWIGTRYGGAAMMAGRKFVDISVGDGLVSEGVWAMTPVEGGGMLFATQRGLQTLTRTRKAKRKWRSYGDTTPVYACGTFVSPTGGLFLWGCDASGVFLADISRDAHPDVPPLVYLTGMSINGREVQAGRTTDLNGRKFELQYSQNTITFDFSGISLRDESSLSYMYILRGLDKDWHSLRRRVPVTYGALRPGKYSFEVKAVNAEGLESSPEGRLAFTIVPPFWRTWWFALSAGLVLLSIAYLSVTMRVKRIIELERVRARIATDLHDDIGSGLTRIAILADVALRQSENSDTEEEADRAAARDEAISAHGVVQKIGLNARELVDSMRDVVWTIDPKNATMGDLISRFRSFANEMCEAGGISFVFEAGDELKDLHLDPALMRTLLLISKEALNNSVKHSGCREIRVRITSSGRRVKLTLSDDGQGLSDGKSSGGHGLDNMTARARRAGGEFVLRSEPDAGTVVEVELPIGR